MILEKVKHLAFSKGISIYALEKECEIGNGTISAWDESTPSIKSLKKVSDYFDVPIEYFLEE